ncbi:hypothetical protein SGPA1_50147 [Streptomyces misionensis JCM 4497]
MATRAGFGPARNVHEWPLAMLDAGPGSGRWLKPRSRPLLATTYSFFDIVTSAARAPAGLERGGDRRAERAALNP